MLLANRRPERREALSGGGLFCRRDFTFAQNIEPHADVRPWLIETSLAVVLTHYFVVIPLAFVPHKAIALVPTYQRYSGRRIQYHISDPDFARVVPRHTYRERKNRLSYLLTPVTHVDTHPAELERWSARIGDAVWALFDFELDGVGKY
jgi:hypothetical protein